MQAIILAAGMGKRLKNLTKDNTKCMVKVNGITLIERMLRILDRKNLSRIIIVDGYKSDTLREYINTLHVQTEIIYVANKIYDKTNNIYSLSLACDYLVDEDTLLFESDLIFEEEVVDQLINDKRPSLAVVDKYENWMDGTCMTIDEEDRIIDFIPGKYVQFTEVSKYYKTVNIYKLSQWFSATTYVPFLKAYQMAMGQNEYYEAVIKLISMLGNNEMRVMRLNGQVWYEIDDIQDLKIAENLFCVDLTEKYRRLCARYGGFWRFPKLLDYCYLVNPYFPTDRMLQEIKSNAEVLVRNYPSGMAEQVLLISKNFNVAQEYVVVGNGAAELINIVLNTQKFAKIGVIRPTFEEYPNRCDNEKIVVFCSSRENFSYNEDDLMEFYDKHSVECLILINPDNPSGNCISYEGLMKLIAWAKNKNIVFIVDESFVDFADDKKVHTLISEDILSSYDKLCVIKSISKSYGVPGIRLGVLLSGDVNLIKELRSKVSIWNINSFGEYFLQIFGRYENDYLKALEQIKSDRNSMVANLKEVRFLKIIPSQANYICCEVLNGIKAQKLAEYMLARNILIKVLTDKIDNGKEYVRLAVRTRVENEYLCQCLMQFDERVGK